MFKFFIFSTLLFINTLLANAPFVIGIAGGTGSGKTTIARKILESLDNAILIEQDCYYRDLSHKTVEERALHNFDHPDSIDFDLLCQNVSALKCGQSIHKPIYSFKTHSRETGFVYVAPAEVIIVEGILIFNHEKLREQFDLKIYVETNDDVRVLRRLERDIQERGRDVISVKHQYLTTVKPMHNQFVEPSKKFADLIVPGEFDTAPAINLIIAGLRKGR